MSPGRNRRLYKSDNLCIAFHKQNCIGLSQLIKFTILKTSFMKKMSYDKSVRFSVVESTCSVMSMNDILKISSLKFFFGSKPTSTRIDFLSYHQCFKWNSFLDS